MGNPLSLPAFRIEVQTRIKTRAEILSNFWHTLSIKQQHTFCPQWYAMMASLQAAYKGEPFVFDEIRTQVTTASNQTILAVLKDTHSWANKLRQEIFEQTNKVTRFTRTMHHLQNFVIIVSSLYRLFEASFQGANIRQTRQVTFKIRGEQQPRISLQVLDINSVRQVTLGADMVDSISQVPVEDITVESIPLVVIEDITVDSIHQVSQEDITVDSIPQVSQEDITVDSIPLVVIEDITVDSISQVSQEDITVDSIPLVVIEDITVASIFKVIKQNIDHEDLEEPIPIEFFTSPSILNGIKFPIIFRVSDWILNVCDDTISCGKIVPFSHPQQHLQNYHNNLNMMVIIFSIVTILYNVLIMITPIAQIILV